MPSLSLKARRWRFFAALVTGPSPGGIEYRHLGRSMPCQRWTAFNRHIDTVGMPDCVTANSPICHSGFSWHSHALCRRNCPVHLPAAQVVCARRPIARLVACSLGLISARRRHAFSCSLLRQPSCPLPITYQPGMISAGLPHLVFSSVQSHSSCSFLQWIKPPIKTRTATAHARRNSLCSMDTISLARDR